MAKKSSNSKTNLSHQPAEMPEYFLRLRECEAAKLGQRAHGMLTYQVLLDPSRENIYIRVVANAGSGSFSDEAVAVSKLRSCVIGRDTDRPLRGSVLQSAINGKSSCNAGFSAAVLVAEGLLGRDPEKRHDLIDLNAWDQWIAEQLATTADLEEIRLKPEDTAAEDTASTEGAATSEHDEGEGNSAESESDEIVPSKGRRKAKGLVDAVD